MATAPIVTLRKTIITALTLFVLDAFFLNQFTIAMLTVLIGIPVFLVKLFLRRKDAERRGLLLARAAIYGGMVVLIVAVFQVNNLIAEKRAESIIAACQQFRARTGSYPEKLAQLVPEYLTAIPRAKPLVAWGESFHYLAAPDSHVLLYTTVPPYGRRGYLLEQKRWQQLKD